MCINENKTEQYSLTLKILQATGMLRLFSKSDALGDRHKEGSHLQYTRLLSQFLETNPYQ